MAHTRDRTSLLPRAFYFFFFAAASALMPFLALHFAKIGLSGRQIGFLSGIRPLVGLVSAPLWGALADVTHRHRHILILAVAGVLIAILALSQATGFYELVAVMLFYAFVGAPITPLVDNTVVAMLGDRKNEYGKQRMWGAFGWGISAPFAGALIDRSGLHWGFIIFLGLMSVNLVISTRLPVSDAGIGHHFRRGLRQLATQRQWLVFLTSVLVGGVALSMELSFLFLYLERLGASKTLMGIVLTVATVSEVPIWFFSDRLLASWGTKGLLLFSLAAISVQAFAYSFIRTPWLALPIQLLHGPAFSAMWAAGVAYASQIAPPGLGATAQGLFAAVATGLRSALGAFIGGVLYQGLGPVLMFRWGGVVALLALAFFWVAGRPATAHAAPSVAD
jgi:MFS transporter, PPP family, 3-phenylpropionic acid transporter